MKKININKLEKILDDMYLNEEFDEINQNSWPENTTEEVIWMIYDRLEKEWIKVEMKIEWKDSEYYSTVWEFIAEWYNEISFISHFDWKFLHWF